MSRQRPPCALDPSSRGHKGYRFTRRRARASSIESSVARRTAVMSNRMGIGLELEMAKGARRAGFPGAALRRSLIFIAGSRRRHGGRAAGAGARRLACMHLAASVVQPSSSCCDEMATECGYAAARRSAACQAVRHRWRKRERGFGGRHKFAVHGCCEQWLAAVSHTHPAVRRSPFRSLPRVISLCDVFAATRRVCKSPMLLSSQEPDEGSASPTCIGMGVGWDSWAAEKGQHWKGC